MLSVYACKSPKETSQSLINITSLRNTRWVLRSINDHPLPKDENYKDVYILFLLDEDKIRGFAGCNNISGKFSVTENEIEFGNIMATKMLCDNIETENNFLKLINRKVRYELGNDKLTLHSENGTEGYFEAIYLK